MQPYTYTAPNTRSGADPPPTGQSNTPCSRPTSAYPPPDHPRYLANPAVTLGG